MIGWSSLHPWHTEPMSRKIPDPLRPQTYSLYILEEIRIEYKKYTE